MAESAAGFAAAPVDRAKERNISMEDLFALEEWYPKTFLLRGQVANGTEID